jgi:hypothetical protein
MTSDAYRKHHVNHSAADELASQADRAKRILERLAADLAALEAKLSSDPEKLEDLVERRHVKQAAERFFESHRSSKDVRPTDGKCVFLSYSHGDEAFASELTSLLEESGVGVFKANRDIRPAAYWIESLRDAICQTRVFALILTSRYFDSDWCKFESGAAFACNKKVLPILRHVDPKDIPDPLHQFKAITVENTSQLEELIERIQELCADGLGGDA